MIYFVLNNSIEYGGGVERAVYNFITNFQRLSKNEIKLVCNASEKPKDFIVQDFQCINLFRHSIISPLIDSLIGKALLLRQLIYSYRVYKYFSSVLKIGDTVVIHGIEYAFCLSFFRKLIKKNFIFIIHLHGTTLLECTEYIHNLPPRYFVARFLFYFFRWYYFILDKISLSGADKLVYLTKNLENYISIIYKFRKVGVVIYNGFYPSAGGTQRTRNKTFTGLIIGSSALRKGLDIAIESIQRVQRLGLNAHLIIVGFPKFYPGALPEYIHYIGQVRPSDMIKVYEKSDFFLLSSRHEGFPLTVLEALQYNIPFIVSGVCRTSEIEGAKGFGFVVDGYDPTEWAKAIYKISDGKTYSKMVNSINAGRKALYSYSWQFLAEKYEKFIMP